MSAIDDISFEASYRFGDNSLRVRIRDNQDEPIRLGWWRQGNQLNSHELKFTREQAITAARLLLEAVEEGR